MSATGIAIVMDIGKQGNSLWDHGSSKRSGQHKTYQARNLF